MALIRVIVELRVPRPERAVAMAMGPSLESLGLALDRAFEPISLIPAAGHALTVIPSAERTMCVRGEIEEGRRAELEAAPDVIRVWSDARIVPCEIESFDLELRTPAEAAAPCSPYDCDYQTPKGDMNDVVRYLGADYIWQQGYRGEGIVIGICDTGVDGTKFSVLDGWSPNSLYPPGTDPDGHGSMCAYDATGICPEAKLYDLGLLKSTGGIEGLLSDALAGYQWALDRYRQDGTPHILSNSWAMYQEAWGPDYARDPNHPFTRKVIEVIREGILVTFAAGNCGEVCPSGRCGADYGPGRSIWGANGHPEVITFGAANTNGEWIAYTSQGPAALSDRKPDVCGISHFKGYTSSDSGTSAANPVGAGVIGLLKCAKPDLIQAEALSVLQRTARDICEPGWDVNSGYGIIDAKAAFEALFIPVGPPDIELSVVELDFGEVSMLIGRTAERSFVVRNVGDGPLSVTNVTSDHAAFTVVGATSFSIGLAGSHEVTINYTPSVEGEQRGTIQISSDDPDEPTVSLSVVGRGKKCFVATAAYGSSLAGEIEVLRYLRDDYLLGRRVGEAFVSLYYRYSPSLADFIGQREPLRRVVRLALRPIVFAGRLLKGK
jgi:hypothetical protein